jgi:hypothetical protein
MNSIEIGFERDSLIDSLQAFTEDGRDCDEQEERVGKLRAERDPSTRPRYWRFVPTDKPLRRKVLCSRRFSPDTYDDTPREQVGYGIPEISPYQRTIVATLLVELYASFISLLSGSHDRLKSGRCAEMTSFFATSSRIVLKTFPFPQQCPSSPLAGSAKLLEMLQFLLVTISELASFACCTPTPVDSLALPDLLGLTGSHKNVAELLIFTPGRLANTSPRRLIHS